MGRVRDSVVFERTHGDAVDDGGVAMINDRLPGIGDLVRIHIRGELIDVVAEACGMVNGGVYMVVAAGSSLDCVSVLSPRGTIDVHYKFAEVI